MDQDVVALCDALRQIDEGRVVSPTWLKSRYPDRGDAVVEALLLESLVASGVETPARLGPYRVLRELGRGGMGVVYLAECDRPVPGVAAGERVAVKVLHARLAARPEAIQAILREAGLGRQVRHPRVVPVLDAGTCVVGGRPSVYVAMPFVDGAPLSRRLREHGAVPEPLCLRLAADVARGLAALHAGGIVHRDVKPSNVLISSSGEALLADLGVAVLRSELACITDRPAFAGTLPYASPEQVAGAELDGRSDLYALGVTLHEMATGVACGGIRDVDLRRRGHSRFFEELVRKLLATRRDARFESPAALLEVLERGEESRWWSRRAAAIRAGGSVAVVRRRRGVPRLHGRTDEMAGLLAAFEEAKAGEGRAVLLVGEAGIGKSRLLDGFLGETARRDEAFRLWRCAFPPVRDPVGTLPLEQSARDLLAGTDLAEAPPLAAGASGYVALAEALAHDLPLVCAFDDLHFASGEERAVVTALASAARGRSLLLVATSREPAPPVLPEGGTRVKLARLPSGAARQLVSDALGARASPEHVAAVAARSGGNPFFAVTLARIKGPGRPLEATPGARMQLPAAIRHLVSERLSSLSGRERELLEVSACYGERIDPEVVARALRRPVPEVTRRLATIANRRGLLRREGAAFVFDHHLVMDTLVREIPARCRRTRRATLAAALEQTLPAQPGGEAAVTLCRLYLDGGRGADALRHVDRALEALASSRHHEAAFQLCERALRTVAPGGAQRLDLLLRAATHGQALGRDRDVEPLLDEALRNAIERGDEAARARVLLQSAERILATGAHEQALSLLAMVGGGSPEPKVDFLCGVALHLLGRQGEAQARLEQAIERSRSCGDVRLEARAIVSLSRVHLSLARFAEARRGYEEALRLSRTVGDREGEAGALSGLAHVLFSADDFEAGERVTRDELALWQRLANRRAEMYARHQLGSCLLERADNAGARREFERCQVLADETRDLSGQVSVATALGGTATHEGRLAEALTWYERGTSIAKTTGVAVGIASGHYGVGVTYTLLGMAAEARGRLETSLALARQYGLRYGEFHVLLGLADAVALEGVGDDVLRLYEEALALHRQAAPDGNSDKFVLAVAQLFLRRGDFERARPFVEQVFGREGVGASMAVLAAGLYAVLPGADVQLAVARILTLEPGTSVRCRMEARFRAWQSTGELGHLVEAYRLLLHMREHAPPNARETILVGVPLHAEIVAAWGRRAAAR